MKKTLFLALISIFIFSTNSVLAQKEDNASQPQKNCYEVYKKAFAERGSYTISDNMYRNVMIVFFRKDKSVDCIRGKVRVEGGYITSIFYFYNDGSSILYEKPFANADNNPPAIHNGISDEIINADHEHLRIVFVDQLKPKPKTFEQMPIPNNL